MVDYGIIYTQSIIHQAGRCDFLIAPGPMRKPSMKRIGINLVRLGNRTYRVWTCIIILIFHHI